MSALRNRSSKSRNKTPKPLYDQNDLQIVTELGLDPQINCAWEWEPPFEKRLTEIQFPVDFKAGIVDLKQWSELRKVSADRGTEIKELDVSELEFLEEVKLGSRFDSWIVCETLKFNNCHALRVLECHSYIGLSSLDLSPCAQLQKLELPYCFNLKNLDITPCTQLQELCLKCGNFPNLDISKCTQIRRLELNYIQGLTYLDMTPCSQLQWIKVDHCQDLYLLDLFECRRLYAYNVIINECPKLKDLRF